MSYVFTGRSPLPSLEARGTSQTLRQAPRPGSALQVPAQERPQHLRTEGRTFSHKLPLTPGHVPSLGTATARQQQPGCLATGLVGLGHVLCPRIPGPLPCGGPFCTRSRPRGVRAPVAPDRPTRPNEGHRGSELKLSLDPQPRTYSGPARMQGLNRTQRLLVPQT